MKATGSSRAWRRVAQVAAALAITGIGARGKAEPLEHGARFLLDMRACPAQPDAGVRHILGIEIGDLLVGVDEPAAGGSDRLTIRCAGNLAWVEAAGDDGAQPVERTLRLSDFPGDAAPRALALAGLELLAARSPALRARIEARQGPPAAPRPGVAESRAARPTPVAAAPPGEAVAPQLRYGLAGIWRRFLVDRGVSAWGGQAQILRRLSHVFELGADVEAGGGASQVALGDASALLISLGPTLGVVGGGAPAGVGLDLGGRLGLVRLAGSAAETAGVTGVAVWHAWGGPVLRARTYVVLGPVALTLSLEAGRSVSTVRGLGGGATVVALGGFWTAISVGGALAR